MTSATIRRTEPQPTAPAITWPRPAAILDADGAQLSEVEVLGPPRDGRLSFGDVHEPAALLDYYFGHGRRQLMLSFDGGTVEGWLETHWEGSHRSWWLELDECEGLS
jgi:hypothetical protein